MKKLKSTLLIILSFCTIGARAGEEIVSDLVKGEEIRTASMVVMDQLYGQSSGFTNHKQQVFLKLFHNDINKEFRNYDWKLKVEYTVELRMNDGTQQTKNDSLIITGDDGTNESGLSKNIDYVFYTGAAYANFTATNVTFKKGNGNNITPITTDFHLQAAVVTERYYDFTPAQSPTVNSATYKSADNTLEVCWDFLQGAEYYDLEWVYVADGDTSGTHQTDNIPYSFENASRVSITNTHYNIPLSYPKGSIIYRIRGVGYDLTQSNFKNYPEYGNWSYQPTTLEISQANSDHSTSKCYYYYTGHDGNKNWTYTVTFAEDGKRKEVASYFDGSGRNRQIVTVQNTDNFAVVGETKYDYVGRGAVNILPAPVSSEGIKFYGTSMSPFNGSWDRDNFATDSHLDESNTVLPEALPSGSEAYKYYSSSNPLSFINKEAVPDAEGYPYTFTQFANDGTDRPVSQSAVGKELRWKAQNNNITRYFYGTPSQSEVDRLFGNEAGKYVFYQKNITIDPNGQQSIQYLDAFDRVVATALAGDNPSTMDTIINKETNTIVTPLFEDKIIGLNGFLQESFKYTSTSFDDVDINYGLNTVEFLTCQQSTSNSLTDIKYDLEIEVKNYRGQLVVDTTMNDITSETNGTLLTFSPSIGDYTITRTIKLDSAHKADYMAMHDTLADFFKHNPACFPTYNLNTDTICPVLDCDSACFNSYSYEIGGIRYYLDTAGNIYEPDPSTGSYFEQGTNGTTTWSEGNANAPFNISIAYCKTECEAFKDTSNQEGESLYRYFTNDKCEISMQVLLSDMSPGGQYLDNTPNNYTYNDSGFATPLGDVDFYIRLLRAD